MSGSDMLSGHPCDDGGSKPDPDSWKHASGLSNGLKRPRSPMPECPQPAHFVELILTRAK